MGDEKKKPGDVVEEITKTNELGDKDLDNVSGGIVGPQDNPE
jgi:bacteriocin-like protein